MDFTNVGLSKEEIKQRLPLSYACARLGINLSREGRALCPLHSESRPSFYLFEHPADMAVLWWCQPCGKGGDVLQLIMEVEHIGFAEAMRRAEQLIAEIPPDYEPDLDLGLSDPDTTPDDWAAEVPAAQARAAAAALEDHLPLVGLTKLTPQDAALEEYLRVQWGWGVDEYGNILMPHWNAKRELTGCKVRRTDGQKISKKGSKYDDLYGSWRGRVNADALITEGETDGVWAAYRAKLEGVKLDVFALPRGATSGLTAQHCKFLGQKKGGTIYLALDPDKAGIDATREAVDTLHAAGLLNVRVCCLPKDKDLREARPSLHTLLGAAQYPMKPKGDVLLGPAGFLRVNKDEQLYPFTTWTIDPIARLSGGQAGYQCRFSYRGREEERAITLSDLASVGALSKWAIRNEVQWLGSDPERKALCDWLEAQASVTPEIFQAERVGVQEAPARYHFAGRSIVYPTGYAGKLPWTYVHGPTTQDVSRGILLPAEGQYRWTWLEDFLALGDTSVTHPLLAWLVAACRRDTVQNFPILFVSGSSGVGKSTIAQLACRLMGSQVIIGLGSSTQFVILRTLSSTTTIPVFIDEWTRQSRKDAREAFQGVITDLYAGGIAQRGQADLSVVTYHLTAPTIVAGEDTFSLDRERDRVVTINPSRAAQNLDALRRLQGQPIELLGQLIQQACVYLPDLPDLDKGGSTRPAFNRGVLEAGWETLHAILEAFAAAGDPDVPALPAQPDLSCFDVVASEVPENVYEVAVQEGAMLTDPRGAAVVWADQDGQGTWVRARQLIGALKRSQLDLDLPGGEKALLNFFNERYESEERKVVPPGSTHRATARLIHGLHVTEPDVNFVPGS